MICPICCGVPSLTWLLCAVWKAYNTTSHSWYFDSFDTWRNNLFMEHRTIEIKLYYLKREENYSLFKTNGVRLRNLSANTISDESTFTFWFLMILPEDICRTLNNCIYSPKPQLFLLFFFLIFLFFFKWKLKPVISFDFSHIVPAHHRHLNQYFLILGNKCSIKNNLEYVTMCCVSARIYEYSFVIKVVAKLIIHYSNSSQKIVLWCHVAGQAIIITPLIWNVQNNTDRHWNDFCWNFLAVKSFNSTFKFPGDD